MIDRAKIGDVATWALVFCAIATTGMVVTKAYLQGSPTPSIETGNTSPIATYVDDWQDALSAGIRIGPADAPIQVVGFTDFECPYCAHFEKTAQFVRRAYPEKVAFTTVHFPLTFHSFAEQAARVSECAHDQGRFEAMQKLLFEKQKTFGLVSWTDFAKQAGIRNIERFDECANDVEQVERISLGKKLAEKMDVRGTPTILVNGWRLRPPPSKTDFEKMIKNVEDGKPIVEDLWPAAVTND